MAIDESIQQRFWAKVDKRGENDCWLWLNGRRHRQGYGFFGIGKRDGLLAHRISFCIHNSLDIDDISGLEIMHSCDNPPCVNPAHLGLGTHKDNMLDGVKRNRFKPTSAKGEKVGSSKLTSMDILRIRQLYTAGIKQTELAKIYGVSQGGCIHYICRHKTWAHI